MTPTKEKALAALLSCSSKEKAAQKAGVTSRTLRNYLNDDDFRRAYQQAFGELVDDATRQAQKSLSPALGTLQEIAKNPEAPVSARIQAARALLEYGIKLIEINDLQARLSALEANMGEQK